MIRKCNHQDIDTVLGIINDAAVAYRDVIPETLYREPYMTREHLESEIQKGVVFFGFKQRGTLIGVMGVQEFPDVTLIRHSYIQTAHRRTGIGGALIDFHKNNTEKPILVGCLKAMTWAIHFYQKHDFHLVNDTERDKLRAKYWSLSQEHVRNSVVLVDQAYKQRLTQSDTIRCSIKLISI